MYVLRSTVYSVHLTREIHTVRAKNWGKYSQLWNEENSLPPPPSIQPYSNHENAIEPDSTRGDVGKNFANTIVTKFRGIWPFRRKPIPKINNGLVSIGELQPPSILLLNQVWNVKTLSGWLVQKVFENYNHPKVTLSSKLFTITRILLVAS